MGGAGETRKRTMTKLIPIAAAALALFGASSAMAQQYIQTPMDGMMSGALNEFNNFNDMLAGTERNLTVGAMNDPQIQMAYQQFVAQGGQQDFATWALNYKWTNGYTPGGVANAYATQNDNTAAIQDSWNGYQGAVNNYNNAYAGMQNGFARNQNLAGMNIQGRTMYTDPTGAQVGLSYMPNAGTMVNPQNNWTYAPNGNGAYTAYDPNGYGHQMPMPW